MDSTAIDQIVARYRTLRRTKGIGVAEPYLTEQVEANPNEPRLHGTRANALLWRGRLEDAEQEAQRAGDTIEGRCSLAEIKVFSGDLDASSAIVEALLTEYPDDFRVLMTAFHVKTVAGGVAECGDVLKHLVEVAGDDPDVYHARLIGAMHARDIEAARTLVEAAPENYRETYQYVQSKAKIAMAAQDLQLAESLHREAVAMAPEADGPWADLAQVLSFQSIGEEAYNCAQYALEINARNSIALNALARIAERQGDFPAAEGLRKRAREAVPFLAYSSIAQRANEERRKGKTDAALTILKELEKEPSAFARRLGVDLRLQILSRTDREKDIEDCLELYSGADRQSPIALASQARLEQLRGNPEAALAHIQEGLALAPDFYHLLAIWLDLKQEAGAEEEIQARFEQWYQRVPGMPTTCAQLVHQLEQMGYRDAAGRLLEASQRAYPNDQNLEVLAIGRLAEQGDSAQVMRRLGGLTGHHAEVRQRVMGKIMLRLLLSPKYWIWRIFKRKKK